MYKIDYHVHSNFSVDSNESMKDAINHAIKIGLNEIAFTDHEDYIFPGILFPHQINYSDYYESICKLQDEYGKLIKITFGIELGLGTYLQDIIKNTISKFPYDFAIGSIHDVLGKDLYLGDFFIGKDKKTAYSEYYKYMLDCIKTIDEFCVIGHMDYISRYGPYADPTHDVKDYFDIIDEILKELINRNKGLELNTSGYRYGLSQVHPRLKILKRYKELGGEIITIGSDAHVKEHIAMDFDKVYAMLDEAGFKYITVYRKLKPEFIKIKY